MYPVPESEINRKKNFKNQKYRDPNRADVYLCETDAFFESDLKVIDAIYMPKERNTKSVAELIYEFFYFYTYEFD